MITVNKDNVMNTAKKLLLTDSPTGFCFNIVEMIGSWAKEMGYEFETTIKGCAVITVPGKSNEKVIGLSAHVDTLGAMVRSLLQVL